MGQLIRLIAKDRDLDNSKLLRRGLDLYVKAHEAEIHKPIRDEYWRLRNRYGD
jgi:hypothetical protein